MLSRSALKEFRWLNRNRNRFAWSPAWATPAMSTPARATTPVSRPSTSSRGARAFPTGRTRLGAEVASTRVRDAEAEGGVREVVLVKPQSFMNTSGGPISKLCREYGVAPEELLVVHDELDIPDGDVR